MIKLLFLRKIYVILKITVLENFTIFFKNDVKSPKNRSFMILRKNLTSDLVPIQKIKFLSGIFEYYMFSLIFD